MYKVIDKFLDDDCFHQIASLTERVPWYFQKTVGNQNDTGDNIFLMTHMFYAKNSPVSPFYEKLIPFLEKLGTDSLIRIKANLYPNTERLHEHAMHQDFEYPNTAALLYLNTCDGYTKLKDGTKISSIANRLLIFDSSEDHCSTTTTNVPARFNINVNYIMPPIHPTQSRFRYRMLQHPELREFRT